MGVDPTNEIAFTLGSSSSASTATLSPCSTLNTPSGSPASFQSAPSQFAVDGSFSLGLRITQLPAAMAIGKNHIGTMAGKLNGEMTPTTPSGCRNEETSTFVDAFSVRLPLSRCASPQANSTTSWPRVTSPRASESTLPCSLVMISAASCLRSFSSSRNRNRICVRRARDMSRHAGHAACAEAMIASASAGDASASRLVTRPVAGSNTSAVRVLSPTNGAPPIQCVTVVIVTDLAVLPALGIASGSVIVVMMGLLNCGYRVGPFPQGPCSVIATEADEGGNLRDGNFLLDRIGSGSCRRSDDRCDAAGQFAGQAAGGDHQGGHDAWQVVLEIGGGDLDRGDHVSAGAEDGRGDTVDVGFEFPAADRDPGQPGHRECVPQPGRGGDGVLGVGAQPPANDPVDLMGGRERQQRTSHRRRRRRQERPGGEGGGCLSAGTHLDVPDVQVPPHPQPGTAFGDLDEVLQDARCPLGQARWNIGDRADVPQRETWPPHAVRLPFQESQSGEFGGQPVGGRDRQPGESRDLAQRQFPALGEGQQNGADLVGHRPTCLNAVAGQHDHHPSKIILANGLEHWGYTVADSPREAWYSALILSPGG